MIFSSFVFSNGVLLVVHIVVMLSSSKHSSRLVKPIVALILASMLLGLLLAINTARNLKREQNLFESSLLREGLSLIRSFGAAVRMGMRHQITGSNSLQTLVEEVVEDEGVLYIRIVGENGEIVAEAGNITKDVDLTIIQKSVETKKPTTRLMKEQHAYEVIRSFSPIPPPKMGSHFHHKERVRWWQEAFLKQPPRVIVVGLSTLEFDTVRKQDIMQAWILGGLLFVLGIAGLFFLLLYQSFRVTRATLANMELYTNNVIESMPTGLISLDRNGGVVSVNGMAKQLLQEIDDVQNEFLSAIDITLEEQELHCPARGRKDIPVKVSVSLLRNHKGEANGRVLILQDMRDIREIEQQLELSRRLASLGRMAAGIAHEIRNPLGTLRGFAQYFANKMAKEDEGKQYAELMVSEVDRLNESVSTLLQFARAPEPQCVQVNGAQLLNKVQILLEADCKAAGVELLIKCDNEHTLVADPDLLLQVLLNIIKNSIQCSVAGGKIEITLSREDTNSVFAIEDNGHGMREEVQKQIFDPFFSTRKEGTGLGLAICHQIVEQHQGSMEVVSHEGEGTLMKVILPVKAGSA